MRRAVAPRQTSPQTGITGPEVKAAGELDIADAAARAFAYGVGVAEAEGVGDEMVAAEDDGGRAGGG